MRHPTIAAAGLSVAAWALVACGSPPAASPPPHQPGARTEAAPAAGTRLAGEASATQAIRQLESAVRAARSAVDAAAATAETATADRRLRLSDTRRAIVAANVALQEAREAFSRGEFESAALATLGVAEHLTAVAEKLRR